MSLEKKKVFRTFDKKLKKIILKMIHLTP